MSTFDFSEVFGIIQPIPKESLVNEGSTELFQPILPLPPLIKNNMPKISEAKARIKQGFLEWFQRNTVKNAFKLAKKG